MKEIAWITDREILGTEGLSAARPRYTARAILTCKGLYAVMHAEKFHLYSLPGGGIEPGEDAVSALRRELLEETGCSCDAIREIGAVVENRAYMDYTQISYYYLVETSSNTRRPRFTEAEAKNGTSVQWRTLDEVISLITAPRHDTTQKKYLQARDAAALSEYLNWIRSTGPSGGSDLK